MPISRGGYTTYLPEDKHHFRYCTSTYHALAWGFQVTMDNYGFTVDVWDPVTKTVKDITTHATIKDRETPYQLPEAFKDPKDMTEAELNEAIDALRGDRKIEENVIRAQRRLVRTKNTKMAILRRLLDKKVLEREVEEGKRKGSYQRRYRFYRPYRHYVTGRTYSPFIASLFS